MLIEEARWLGEQLQRLEPVQAYPLLDVGSSTARFRTQEQPWIEREIFAPARVTGGRVVHLDAKPAEGVDVVADLADPHALQRLAGEGFRTVLCSNLLEHVAQPEAIARALAQLVRPGGHLLVSGPYRYPRHPDPIDTMFRPAPAELAQVFPGTRIVSQAVVTNGTYLDEIRRRPAAFARLLLRLLMPFYQPAGWRREGRQLLRHLPWLFRRFSASCVLLERSG